MDPEKPSCIREGCEATVMYGNSYDNPNIYYMTRFLCSDNLIYIKTGKEDVLITNSMEEERAEEEACVDRVTSPKNLKNWDSGKDSGFETKSKLIDVVLQDCGYEDAKVCVDSNFPVGLYKEMNCDVKVVEGLLDERRSVKDSEEIEEIRKSQESAHASVVRAREILAESNVEDGILLFDGEFLTQGRLKKEILNKLLERDCYCEGVIVSSGDESAFPHKTGTDSKKIRAGVPIIVDVFPLGRSSRYHGDITRTFVKGKPKKEVKEIHEAVLEAQKAALNCLKPGILAAEVDKEVRSVFKRNGYTQEKNKANGAEFKHSTGHGIGLEVHEKPRIGKESKYRLSEGNVVAIEPGLYDKELGGVRIEDVAVIREDGSEVLGRMNRSMEV